MTAHVLWVPAARCSNLPPFCRVAGTVTPTKASHILFEGWLPLEDPRRCRFDPAALQCPAQHSTGACLTPAQVEAARRVYRGLKDPATGAQLYPGLVRGSEPFYQRFLKADTRFAPILNATNPDLGEFPKRRGKLLQYHGWNDQLISALNSIDYYESVILRLAGTGKNRAAALSDVQSFYRLVMAPGMTHCSGGTGQNSFDLQAALEQWIE